MTSLIEPLAVRLPEAQRVLGKCRSGIYEAIGNGQLVAVKDGKSILITVESIQRYQRSLPRADIKPPQRKLARKRRRSRE